MLRQEVLWTNWEYREVTKFSTLKWMPRTLVANPAQEILNGR